MFTPLTLDLVLCALWEEDKVKAWGEFMRPSLAHFSTNFDGAWERPGEGGPWPGTLRSKVEKWQVPIVQALRLRDCSSLAIQNQTGVA